MFFGYDLGFSEQSHASGPWLPSNPASSAFLAEATYHDNRTSKVIAFIRFQIHILVMDFV